MVQMLKEDDEKLRSHFDLLSVFKKQAVRNTKGMRQKLKLPIDKFNASDSSLQVEPTVEEKLLLVGGEGLFEEKSENESPY